jgi:flagellar hook-associated protein FlgK
MKESYTQQYQSKTTLDRPSYVNWQLQRASDTIHLFDQRLDSTSQSISGLEQRMIDCSKVSELACNTSSEAQKQIRDLSYSLEARFDKLETRLDKLQQQQQQQQQQQTCNINNNAILVLLDKWESRIQTLISTQFHQSDRSVISLETRLEDKITTTHTTMNTLADKLCNVEKKIQMAMDIGRRTETTCSGLLNQQERLVGRVEGVEQGLVEVGVVQAGGRGAQAGLEESVFRLRSEVLNYMNSSSSHSIRGGGGDK